MATKSNPTTHAAITRTFATDKGVFGDFRIYQNGKVVFRCATLERPWEGNKRRVSCIPKGSYELYLCGDKSYNLVNSYQRKYGKDNVPYVPLLRGTRPQRYGIFIHIGNYIGDSEGCILVGETKDTAAKKGGKSVFMAKQSKQAFIRLVNYLQYYEPKQLAIIHTESVDKKFKQWKK